MMKITGRILDRGEVPASEIKKAYTKALSRVAGS